MCMSLTGAKKETGYRITAKSLGKRPRRRGERERGGWNERRAQLANKQETTRIHSKAAPSNLQPQLAAPVPS